MAASNSCSCNMGKQEGWRTTQRVCMCVKGMCVCVWVCAIGFWYIQYEWRGKTWPNNKTKLTHNGLCVQTIWANKRYVMWKEYVCVRCVGVSLCVRERERDGATAAKHMFNCLQSRWATNMTGTKYSSRMGYWKMRPRCASTVMSTRWSKHWKKGIPSMQTWRR